MYKEESGEEILLSEDDLKKNWFCKLCNNMKKPTGRMGADAKDCINRCIEIERRILDKMSSGVLGALSEEDCNSLSLSSSSGDEEYKDESEEDKVPGTEVQPNLSASFLPPPTFSPFFYSQMKRTHSKTNPQKTTLQIPMLPIMTPTLMPLPMELPLR